MNKPRVPVPHAGCPMQGFVTGQNGVIVCDGCHKRITDPMELAPRGTGFTPDHITRRIERYRLEA